ncbi:MAG: SH3 domain-containing protein [Pseudomonadota bacterium]
MKMFRFLVCFLVFLAGAAFAETRYINSPGDGFLNLRKGPATSYSIIMEMKHGTSAKVLSRSGKWLKVRHQTGRTGWAHGRYLVARSAVKPRQSASASVSGTQFTRATRTLKAALKLPGTSLRLCDTGLSIFVISESPFSCASTDKEILTDKQFAIEIDMGLVIMQRMIAPKGRAGLHNAICGGRNRTSQRHSSCKFKFSNEIRVIREKTRHGSSYHYVFGVFDRGDQLALSVAAQGATDPRKLAVDRLFRRNGFKLR